jgi:hypothetical protein
MWKYIKRLNTIKIGKLKIQIIPPTITYKI